VATIFLVAIVMLAVVKQNMSVVWGNRWIDRFCDIADECNPDL
jgi:hypothetical protein